MGFSLGDLGSFAVGAIKQDEKNTAEKLVDRRAELQADRAMHIKMKEQKYQRDIKAFDEENKKFKAIQSVNAEFKGMGEISSAQYGERYLSETNPDLLLKYKTLYAENPNKLNEWLSGYGNESLKNFKTTNTIDSLDANKKTSIDEITAVYKTKLEEARGDSFLINKILGDRKKAIATVETVSQDGENGIILSNELNKNEENKDDMGFSFGEAEKVVYVPTKFRTAFTTDIKKAREIDYSSKEYNKKISDTVLTLVPNAKTKDFFTVDKKDGTLIAKPAIINADVTIQALMNNSLKDENVNDTYTITNGATSKIDLSTNTRYNTVKNHIEEYGQWYAEGKVLNGGNIKNLLKATSTALVVPSNSIININSNKLKGYNITINKSLRKDVGKVYTNFIDVTARERMKTQGGTLEQNINSIQNQLQNDNNGNEQLTQDARTYIALALKDVKDSKGEFIYPSLQKTSEETQDKNINVIDENKSTADIKQEELSSGKINSNVDNTAVRTVTVTINGKQENVPLTEKNKKILEANKISIPAVQEDTMTGDGSAMEKIANETVVEKIKPIDVGSDNQSGYFETLDSIKAILPNDMSGQEIMDKYNIAFPINKFTVYKSSK